MELELPTFEEWLLLEYPMPDPEKDDYAEYALKKWGLYTALSHVYPHVFSAYGKTNKDIYDEERQKYHWWCVDAVIADTVDGPPEATEEQFLAWLTGLSVVTTSKSLELILEREIPAGTRGVALWGIDSNTLCLFSLGEDLVLRVLKSDEFIATDIEFSGWEDLR